MTARPWSRLLIVALSLLAAAPLAFGEDASEDEHLSRLRAMTRQERETLAKNLAEFDKLSKDERQAIATLNRELADADPKMRARYLAVLRRYHVFYQNLSPENRKALDEAADPAAKLKLIDSFRAQPKRSRQEIRRFADALQISALSPARLQPVARHLIVYFNLDPVKDAKERSELARTSDFSKRQVMVQNLIRSKGLRPALLEEEKAFRTADAKVLKWLDRVENEFVKAEVERAKRAKREPMEAATKTKKLLVERRPELLKKFDEIQVINYLENQPVDPANLDRFEAALPAWAREPLDGLPPEAARRRLKVLYRVVYPPGEEMPIPKATKPARSSNTPRPPADGPASPF